MDKQKIIRRICNVGIGVLLPLFLVGVLWFLTGSLETEPSAEQVEKARLAAGLFMTATGIPCAICIYYRIKFRK